LGIGYWAQSPIPNPQSPIPNPHLIDLILNENYFCENINIIFIFIYFHNIIKIKILLLV